MNIIFNNPFKNLEFQAVKGNVPSVKFTVRKLGGDTYLRWTDRCCVTLQVRHLLDLHLVKNLNALDS